MKTQIDFVHKHDDSLAVLYDAVDVDEVDE
jgi:hypothetical protein